MAKIAIIEDDPSIAQMYKLKFDNAGHKSEIAEDGKRGLELCEKMQPDIVLLDLMMPEMNGDEMLEKMRATDWGKKPKVMILTNVSITEAPQRLKKLDVEGYIVKAETTPKLVEERVQKLLVPA
jgi:DNA-binding response OmpR family regulator